MTRNGHRVAPHGASLLFDDAAGLPMYGTFPISPASLACHNGVILGFLRPLGVAPPPPIFVFFIFSPPFTFLSFSLFCFDHVGT